MNEVLMGFGLVVILYSIFIIFSTFSVTRDLGYGFISSVVLALLMPIVGLFEAVIFLLATVANFVFDQACLVGGIDPDEYQEKINEFSDEEI